MNKSEEKVVSSNWMAWIGPLETKWMLLGSDVCWSERKNRGKLKKILKSSLNSIPSPSPLVKIQIMGGKICLRCKDKTLLSVVNKLLKTKSLLTTPSAAMFFYYISSKLFRPQFERAIFQTFWKLHCCAKSLFVS